MCTCEGKESHLIRKRNLQLPEPRVEKSRRLDFKTKQKNWSQEEKLSAEWQMFQLFTARKGAKNMRFENEQRKYNKWFWRFLANVQTQRKTGRTRRPEAAPFPASHGHTAAEPAGKHADLQHHHCKNVQKICDAQKPEAAAAAASHLKTHQVSLHSVFSLRKICRVKCFTFI